MKPNLSGAKTRAFNFIELLMVIAALALLAALLLPAMTRPRRSSRLGCVSNLKQVTLAFKVWAMDNGDKYPMEVSTNFGGTMEFLAGTNMFVHYLVMSNELNTPKILFCPNETSSTRAQATTWNPTPPPGQVPYLGSSNVSYFVGIDATETNVMMFLVGDHNVTNGLPLRNGILELSTNRPAGWTEDNHKLQGNVGLSDASVHTYYRPQLRNAIQSTGVATNRLAMP